MKTVKFKLISALLLLIIAFSLTNCIISKDDKKEYDQLKARCELESQNKSTVRQVFEAINEKNTEKIYNFTDSAQKIGERGLIISEILTDSDEAQKFSEEMSKIAECFFNTAIDISNR